MENMIEPREDTFSNARVLALDTLRGITVLSMCAFHVAYDLAYIFEIPMPWFTQGIFQDIWRSSISWTFLFLAGWTSGFSKSNFKRAVKYGLCSMAIFIITSFAKVDTPISFGILFCMAASTLIASLLDRCVLPGKLCSVLAVAGAILFLAFQGIPEQIYEFRGLEWLGFPSEGFYSGDYYPLLPYSLLFMSAYFAQRAHSIFRYGYPTWSFQDYCPLITWIGQHSLQIYLIHQPLALLVLMLVLN